MDPAEVAKRTVQQRESAFISVVCRSEDQVEKRFQSRKRRGKEQQCKLLQVNRTSWGKEKERSRREKNSHKSSYPNAIIWIGDGRDFRKEVTAKVNLP